MDLDEGSTFATFLQHWTSDNLNKFLSRKVLKVRGTKDDLAARAFAAWEATVPDQSTEEEVIMKQLGQEYQDLLRCDEGFFKDPLLLQTGWKCEDNAVKEWPPTMYWDIAEYFNKTDRDLANRLHKDYKEGKAYSYLESGWVGALEYNANVVANIAF